VGAITIVTLVLGVVVYGVNLQASTLPGVILALVLGTAAFTTPGIGIVRFISNAEAAPVIVNLVILPLSFISGIFFPTDTMPKVVVDIARLFPILALADALQFAFDPRTSGAGVNWADIRTLVIWTAVGMAMMPRFLRTPQGDVQ
jgi:ABC-2 type transport system permease protein